MVGLRAPWGVEGGVEQAVAELAPRLVAAGCQVSVYCRGRYNPYGSILKEGVQLIDLPTVYGRGMEAFLHSALAAPVAALHHDIVHLHAAGPALFSPLPRLLGRKVVVTLHGKDWEREKWGLAARGLLRLGASVAGRSASHLIGVSEALSQWARRFSLPVSHIPNGVSPHQFVPWNSDVFPGLSPGGYDLYLGRLVPEKELHTLFEAIQLSGRHLPVVVAGGSSESTPYAARLRQEAPSVVRFVGSRFGAEKAMLLSHARSFLFPSRVEGFSIALLEAMAAGLPVVASDIPPNFEALGDLSTRIPPGDVGAWAAALRLLDETPLESLRRQGMALQARAHTYFSWSQAVDQTLAVYRSVLA